MYYPSCICSSGILFERVTGRLTDIRSKRTRSGIQQERQYRCRDHAVSHPPLPQSASLAPFHPSLLNSYSKANLQPIPLATLTHLYLFSINSPQGQSQNQSSSSSNKSKKSSYKNSPQLDAWRNKKEPHEQVAVGERSTRRFADTMIQADNAARRAQGGSWGGR